MTPRAEWLVLATLWVVVFAASCQFLIVAPLLPEIGTALDIPEQLRGTLVSGYALMVAGAALVAGPISDQVGRRTILRSGSIVMTVALCLHAVAWSYGSMLAVRMLAGAASGILSGAAVAYIGDLVPYARRGQALGLVLSGMAFGQIVGIPAGRLMAEPFGFQAPFVVFGAVMAVGSALTWVVLPAVVQAPKAPLAARAVAVAYLELLRRGDILAICVSGFVMMLSVSAYLVYLPTWMEAELGAGAGMVALLFAVGGTSSALSGPIMGRLSDRFGRKLLVVWGSIGVAGAMLLTLIVPNAWWLLGVFFVSMALASARMTPLNAMLTAMVGPERRGTLMSLTMATSQLGFAAGSAAAGWVYTHVGYAGDVAVAVVGSVLAGLVVAVWVDEPSLVVAAPVEAERR